MNCDVILQVSSAVGRLSCGGGGFATCGYLGNGYFVTSQHLQHVHSDGLVLHDTSTCETGHGYSVCREGSTAAVNFPQRSSHNAERPLTSLAVVSGSQGIWHSLKSLLEFAMCDVEHVYEGQQLVAVHVSVSVQHIPLSSLALQFAQVILQLQQHVMTGCQQINC